MSPFKNTRADSSPNSSSPSGTSTLLYFSDTDFNSPEKAAEMTNTTIDEDLLNVRHSEVPRARERKIKRLTSLSYNSEGFEKSVEPIQQDCHSPDTVSPSLDLKMKCIIPPWVREDMPWRGHKRVMMMNKMCGSRRKRYLWSIQHGYSIEEAIVKSAYRMHSVHQTEHFSKNRLEKNLNELERYKSFPINFLQSKENKEAIKPSNSFKSVEEKEIRILMGIFPASFPEVKFQKEQFEVLQDCLSEYILKDTASMPQFHGTICKNGWLQITCGNMTAVQWLKNIVPFLKPWKGAQLHALEEKDFPKPMNLICFLPKSSKISNECILNYLKKQNPKNLDICSWKILHREDSFDTTKAVFSIDNASAVLLAKDGAKLYYMLNSVNFMVINAPLDGPENSSNLTNYENVAGPSRCTSEYSSYALRNNSNSSYISRQKRKSMNFRGPRDRLKKDLQVFKPHHNDGKYPSASSLRNFEQEIGLLKSQPKHNRKTVRFELELERKFSQLHNYDTQRSFPRRYNDDHRDRNRKQNRRDFNSLILFKENIDELVSSDR